MNLKVLPLTLLFSLGTMSWPHAQQGSSSNLVGDPLGATEMRLMPTEHPPIPRDLAAAWLAPDRTGARPGGTATAIAGAAKLFAGGDYAKTLAVVAQPTLQEGPLSQYAVYYAGVSQLKLERPADALKSFRALQQQKPVGYLAEAAQLGEADAHLALERPKEALEIYERLLAGKPSSLEDILMRVGRAAKAAGDQERAAESFARVYYEFALSEAAVAAGSELALLNVKQAAPGSPRYKLELGRAERLFGARQYARAKDAFDELKSLADGDDREIVQLRLAESDYYLKRYRAARDAMKPLVEGKLSRKAEALYFYALASRDLGDPVTYLRIVNRILAEYPTDSWAEFALDSLGTYYIRKNEDDKADEAFRRLFDTFPNGTTAERAAWKAGWRAYRQDKFVDALRFFEQAALEFPRSDYRPSWLYWSARAHQELGNVATANERFGLVVADYLNSYYGRLAAAWLGGTDAAKTTATTAGGAKSPGSAAAAKPTGSAPSAAVPAPQLATLPQNGDVIRALLSASMYDDAMNELRYARRVWGDSPSIQATQAWASQQQALSQKGMARFQLMRGGLNTMRRAYPQFMAAGGEQLPREVLTVIYPVAYWDVLQRHATKNNLDPFLVAALTLQESTFVPDVRSHANAYGLMQLLPSTARQYARKLGMPYSSRLLTDPEANIRMGTAYFADKIKEFGSPHLALASYNAGERAVRKWMAEKPDLERDEFIDDIPYPETQGYVRKILGMAEDYRRLYAGVLTPAANEPRPATSAAPAPTPKATAPKAAPKRAAPKATAPKATAPKATAPKASATKPAARPAAKRPAAKPAPKPRPAPRAKRPVRSGVR